MPAFEKYNPKGKQPKSRQQFANIGRDPFQSAGNTWKMPFGKMVMTAVLLHRVWVLLRKRFFKPQVEESEEEEEEEDGAARMVGGDLAEISRVL